MFYFHEPSHRCCCMVWMFSLLIRFLSVSIFWLIEWPMSLKVYLYFNVWPMSLKAYLKTYHFDLVCERTELGCYTHIVEFLPWASIRQLSEERLAKLHTTRWFISTSHITHKTMNNIQIYNRLIRNTYIGPPREVNLKCISIFESNSRDLILEDY